MNILPALVFNLRGLNYGFNYLSRDSLLFKVRFTKYIAQKTIYFEILSVKLYTDKYKLLLLPLYLGPERLHAFLSELVMPYESLYQIR